MKRTIDRDFLSGLCFVGFGAWVVAYARSKYEFGTLSSMESGYFPVLLGSALVLIGLIVITITFFRKTEPLVINIRLRPLVAVIGAILFFALTVERLGLIPAVLGMTLVATAAEKPFAVQRGTVLGIFLGALAWVIFVAGLDMSLVAFNFKGL